MFDHGQRSIYSQPSKFSNALPYMNPCSNLESSFHLEEDLTKPKEIFETPVMKRVDNQLESVMASIAAKPDRATIQHPWMNA